MYGEMEFTMHTGAVQDEGGNREACVNAATGLLKGFRKLYRG
jgi:hypothetical protein